MEPTPERAAADVERHGFRQRDKVYWALADDGIGDGVGDVGGDFGARPSRRAVIR
jgi:hypothetical protein